MAFPSQKWVAGGHTPFKSLRLEKKRIIGGSIKEKSQYFIEMTSIVHAEKAGRFQVFTRYPQNIPEKAVICSNSRSASCANPHKSDFDRLDFRRCPAANTHQMPQPDAHEQPPRRCCFGFEVSQKFGLQWFTRAFDLALLRLAYEPSRVSPLKNLRRVFESRGNHFYQLTVL